MATPAPRRANPATDRTHDLAEHELTALWLLGRVPAAALPWPLLRPGRAGRGPGPDVREALFARAGVPACGDVEVHLRASDFVRHGHLADPAYRGLVLHLVWEDDRPAGLRGAPQALSGGEVPTLEAPTVEVGAVLGWSARRLRALLALGPSGAEPCLEGARTLGARRVTEVVRREGQRRLAERARRAAGLAIERGWPGAWALLLDAALVRSAGRHAEAPAARERLSAVITASVGAPLEQRLATLAADRTALIEALRGGGALGVQRAAEVGWNAALPLLIALATAYEDVTLARATARLAAEWPAPRPYGRTRALEGLLRGHATGAPGASLAPRGRPPASTERGALWAQGLLHLQDLWCTRGGCGACPLSAVQAAPPALLAVGGAESTPAHGEPVEP